MIDDTHRYAMIMAGGTGTRLWPLSRKSLPKQLVPLINSKSLLELAADRLEGIVPLERRYICTAESYRPLIRKAIPDFPDENILGEPIGRDTVNAVGFTAAVLAKVDPDAVFVVLTADHVIEPVDEFRRKLQQGYQLVEAESNRLVTFSILPSSPATEYGYVERGKPISGANAAYIAKRFVEKPDAATAKAYVDAGTFGWNSGMFVFGARSFLDALKKYKPRSHEGIMTIADAWGTPRQAEVLRKVYPMLPKISVDYAIMEPACRDNEFSVCTVTMGVWWQDIGSWPTYGESLPTDPQLNAANTKTLHLDSRNIIAVSSDPNHTIATVGCDDLIIVHTKDVTLVCPRSEAQRVKELAEMADESLQ